MNKSTVYLLKCGEFYKIGRTSNHVNLRVKQLQTSNPEQVEIVHFKDKLNHKQSITEEVKLHKIFSHCRVSGEWFSLTLHEVTQCKFIMDGIIPIILETPCKPTDSTIGYHEFVKDTSLIEEQQIPKGYVPTGQMVTRLSMEGLVVGEVYINYESYLKDPNTQDCIII